MWRHTKCMWDSRAQWRMDESIVFCSCRFSCLLEAANGEVWYPFPCSLFYLISFYLVSTTAFHWERWHPDAIHKCFFSWRSWCIHCFLYLFACELDTFEIALIERTPNKRHCCFVLGVVLPHLIFFWSVDNSWMQFWSVLFQHLALVLNLFGLQNHPHWKWMCSILQFWYLLRHHFCPLMTIEF